MRAALVDMCSEQDLQEASYRAGEQLLLIVGVVSLCCILYLVSALAESLLGDRRKGGGGARGAKAPLLGSAEGEGQTEEPSIT